MNKTKLTSHYNKAFVLLPSGTQCELHQSETFPNLNQLFNWLKLMESISCFSSSSCPIKLIKDQKMHIINYSLYSECSEIRSVYICMKNKSKIIHRKLFLHICLNVVHLWCFYLVVLPCLKLDDFKWLTNLCTGSNI